MPAQTSLDAMRAALWPSMAGLTEYQSATPDLKG